VVGYSVWRDILGLTMAVTLLEAALAGQGTTVGHGRRSHWRIAPWSRPIFGVIGCGLLGIVVADFLRHR